jgi:hypothetical protein
MKVEGMMYKILNLILCGKFVPFLEKYTDATLGGNVLLVEASTNSWGGFSYSSGEICNFCTVGGELVFPWWRIFNFW